jgi:uncharacterized protein HemX
VQSSDRQDQTTPPTHGRYQQSPISRASPHRLPLIPVLPAFEGSSMSTLRSLLLALAMALGLSGMAFAKVNCSDVKNENKDECVRAKANKNSNNINCSDVKNKNRDECVRAKANTNNRDMDDVNCSNAKDADVRQACRKAK